MRHPDAFTELMLLDRFDVSGLWGIIVAEVLLHRNHSIGRVCSLHPRLPSSQQALIALYQGRCGLFDEGPATKLFTCQSLPSFFAPVFQCPEPQAAAPSTVCFVT
jgi:hypothetical protein